MRADYVINSGVFTVKSTIPEKQWRRFVHDMARAMFGVAEKGTFNLMTSFVDYRDDHLFYEDPDAILDFCVSELSRKVVIRHDYPLWEYAVYVYKQTRPWPRAHMTRLVIFGNGEIAELAHYYFSTDSAYLVEGFTVDAEFLETESFCGLPLVPFENFRSPILRKNLISSSRLATPN